MIHCHNYFGNSFFFIQVQCTKYIRVDHLAKVETQVINSQGNSIDIILKSSDVINGLKGREEQDIICIKLNGCRFRKLQGKKLININKKKKWPQD